jgi:hypothetical protein
MTDKVIGFPNRTPPNRGDLWHSIIDAMIAQYPLKNLDQVARAVGANPALVGTVVDCLMAEGIVRRKGSVA